MEKVKLLQWFIATMFLTTVFLIIHLTIFSNHIEIFLEKKKLLKNLKNICTTEEIKKINNDLNNFKTIDNQCDFLKSILRKKEEELKKKNQEKIKELTKKY